LHLIRESWSLSNSQLEQRFVRGPVQGAEKPRSSVPSFVVPGWVEAEEELDLELPTPLVERGLQVVDKWPGVERKFVEPLSLVHLQLYILPRN
jgi:hypothetical protein